MGGEEGGDVHGGVSVLDVGEELKLGLHAARGEDGQGFASGFPGLEGGEDIFKERGLEMAIGKGRGPKMAWSAGQSKRLRQHGGCEASVDGWRRCDEAVR